MICLNADVVILWTRSVLTIHLKEDIDTMTTKTDRNEPMDKARLQRESELRREASRGATIAPEDAEYLAKLRTQRSRVDMQVSTLDKANIAAMAAMKDATITHYLVAIHRAHFKRFLATATPEQLREIQILADDFYGKFTGPLPKRNPLLLMILPTLPGWHITQNQKQNCCAMATPR